jgi:hypothetical protein
MLVASHVIGSVSAALLVAALAYWMLLRGFPALRRLDGGLWPALGKNEVSSRLLVAGAGLSLVAAPVAIAGLLSH